MHEAPLSVEQKDKRSYGVLFNDRLVVGRPNKGSRVLDVGFEAAVADIVWLKKSKKRSAIVVGLPSGQVALIVRLPGFAVCVGAALLKMI